jgi:hypothetical protein
MSLKRNTGGRVEAVPGTSTSLWEEKLPPSLRFGGQVVGASWSCPSRRRHDEISIPLCGIGNLLSCPKGELNPHDLAATSS